MNEQKIKELLKEYFEKKKEYDKISEEVEFIKNNIKILMEADGIDYFEDEEKNDIKFRESTRKTLDKTLVERKLAPEEFEKCFKETTFTSLTIRSKDAREAIENRFKKIKS